MLPFYDEPYEVLEESVRSYLNAEWDAKSIAVVVASEARAGETARLIAEKLKENYGDQFLEILVTTHPEGLSGDIPGKGSNLSYAVEEARKGILDKRGIPYEHVIVSAFDSDTVVYPQYFACLTYHVMTEEEPLRASFQPVPLYNNNIWEAPMLSRVIAYSSSFWQMIQQERPEKLATFSSHALVFKSLYDAGYWQRNVVSEDSRIFWNLFARYDGEYKVVPMAYPVSMDANVAPTFWKTAKNIYKQHRRWTYGVENIPYILFTFLKNPRIPLGKKIRFAFFQIEGFWSLATHPLILFAIGWLPMFVGGSAFNATVLSYNLPFIAKSFLTAAMFGLVVSAAICMYLIPDPPEGTGRMRKAMMVVQWILVPATMVAFSSIPGLESQIRLAIGKYFGFWVTPKTGISRKFAIWQFANKIPITIFKPSSLRLGACDFVCKLQIETCKFSCILFLDYWLLFPYATPLPLHPPSLPRAFHSALFRDASRDYFLCRRLAVQNRRWLCANRRRVYRRPVSGRTGHYERPRSRPERFFG